MRVPRETEVRQRGRWYKAESDKAEAMRLGTPVPGPACCR